MLLCFLKRVSSQSRDAITRIECLGQLRTAYQERLPTERTAARLLQTLDVPYRTAQRYVERLEEIGILREVTG